MSVRNWQPYPCIGRPPHRHPQNPQDTMVSTVEFLAAGGTYGRKKYAERLNGVVWSRFGDGWVEPTSDDRIVSLLAFRYKKAHNQIADHLFVFRRKVRALRGRKSWRN